MGMWPSEKDGENWETLVGNLTEKHRDQIKKMVLCKKWWIFKEPKVGNFTTSQADGAQFILAVDLIKVVCVLWLWACLQWLVLQYLILTYKIYIYILYWSINILYTYCCYYCQYLFKPDSMVVAEYLSSRNTQNPPHRWKRKAMEKTVGKTILNYGGLVNVAFWGILKIPSLVGWCSVIEHLLLNYLGITTAHGREMRSVWLPYRSSWSSHIISVVI